MNVEYQIKILSMDKLELLNEMVRFQEYRSKQGSLSKTDLERGKILFTALEKTAETPELASLSKSYRKHLTHELKEMIHLRLVC